MILFCCFCFLLFSDIFREKSTKIYIIISDQNGSKFSYIFQIKYCKNFFWHYDNELINIIGSLNFSDNKNFRKNAYYFFPIF